MTKTSFFFCILLAAGAVPAFASDIMCLQGLAEAELPACVAKQCEDIRGSARMLALCAGADGGFRSAEVVVCINEQNGASKYFPPNLAAQECGRLSQHEPSWELKRCYCCC